MSRERKPMIEEAHRNKSLRDSATIPEREVIRSEFLSLDGSRFERVQAIKRLFGLSYVFISLVLNEEEKTHARSKW